MPINFGIFSSLSLVAYVKTVQSYIKLQRVELRKKNLVGFQRGLNSIEFDRIL